MNYDFEPITRDTLEYVLPAIDDANDFLPCGRRDQERSSFRKAGDRQIWNGFLVLRRYV
jgi:hypothetical protein